MGRFRRGSWLYWRHRHRQRLAITYGHTRTAKRSNARKRGNVLKVSKPPTPLGRWARVPSPASAATTDGNPCAESDVDTEDDLEELSRALDLDKRGRLRGVSGLNYKSASFSQFVSATAAATLKADCLVLDRLETQRGEGSNVSSSKPRRHSALM